MAAHKQEDESGEDGLGEVRMRNLSLNSEPEADQSTATQPWYWPHISRGEAERILARQPEGTFLVRDCTVPGDYTLTVRKDSCNKYVRIYRFKRGYSLERRGDATSTAGNITTTNSTISSSSSSSRSISSSGSIGSVSISSSGSSSSGSSGRGGSGSGSGSGSSSLFQTLAGLVDYYRTHTLVGGASGNKRRGVHLQNAVCKPQAAPNNQYALFKQLYALNQEQQALQNNLSASNNSAPS